MVTEPEATAQWMKIFHAVVIAASTATLMSMHPKYPDNSGGAPSATSSKKPTATDVMMNESTTSLARLVPTFLSPQRPRRTPRVMNSVGSTAAKKAASSPQPSPAAPSACQPIAMTVAMIQFFGSSRYVTRRAAASRVTGTSRQKATTWTARWQVASVRAGLPSGSEASYGPCMPARTGAEFLDRLARTRTHVEIQGETLA